VTSTFRHAQDVNDPHSQPRHAALVVRCGPKTVVTRETELFGNNSKIISVFYYPTSQRSEQR